ncbi:hypothetical protein BDB00DRAFT_930305 [Zychaea mexicana]|uniref:uncharacterized protein n=1 Tax=Zychaea mexicana TaxID=64656 RepID=UPI0022FE5440|nr:uncharacterized protein BDB00DRAFT_930305 [Zychaea mexicana]KAI9491737.1 hypothetical protein BDB00DRAFT_930305 [Zychaea mexicana]
MAQKRNQEHANGINVFYKTAKNLKTHYNVWCTSQVAVRSIRNDDKVTSTRRQQLQSPVTYGDGSFPSSMKGLEPLPIEGGIGPSHTGNACGPVFHKYYLFGLPQQDSVVSTSKEADENGQPRVGRLIDRNLNAGSNIGRIITAYTDTDGDPNSRPPILRRPNYRNRVIDNVLQEEELQEDVVASDEEEE